MTRNLLLATAAVFLSSASATADRIYLKTSSAPATSTRKAAEEELPSIEGVVTAETEESVTIRVEGGDVTIAKSKVARIEKGGLTLEDIQKRESDLASRETPADQARRTAHAQWVEASARKDGEGSRTASDTGGDRPLEIVVDFRGLLPAQVLRFYDPVLHVVRTVPVLERIDMDGLARTVEAYLIDELRRLELR
jgi:hypothetical protein